MSDRQLPDPPPFPPCRVQYETPFGALMFRSQEDLDIWKKEPFWKKALGLTSYDKCLKEAIKG